MWNENDKKFIKKLNVADTEQKIYNVVSNFSRAMRSDLKKTQLDMVSLPALPISLPSERPVGTKSSGLKTALRNEFDKIDRARITLVQVTDQLVKLREKNIVGKGEPGQGWIVNEPETGKTIRCNSKQEFDLEVRRCVAVARMIKAGKECKDYLIAIVAKMKAEKEEKEQEKLAQKALKREQELEMIRPQGEVMRSKVKTFAAALKLEGDPASWFKEILATNVDEATGICSSAEGS
eukprot:g7865.t1